MGGKRQETLCAIHLSGTNGDKLIKSGVRSTFLQNKQQFSYIFCIYYFIEGFFFFKLEQSNHERSAVYYNVHKTQACISSMMTVIKPPLVMMDWVYQHWSSTSQDSPPTHIRTPLSSQITLRASLDEKTISRRSSPLSSSTTQT